MSVLDRPYSKNERRILSTILQPANKTVEQVAKQVINYGIIHGLAADVLRTNLARHKELMKELRENPSMSHIVVIDGPTPNHGPRGLGIREYDDQPEALWELLSQYDAFLQQESQTYEHYFWRSVYSISGMMLAGQFAYKALEDTRGGIPAFERCKGKMERIAVREAFPEQYEAALREQLRSHRPIPLVTFRRASIGPPTQDKSGSASAAFSPKLTEDEIRPIIASFELLASKDFMTLADEDEDSDSSDGSVRTWKVVTIDVRTQEATYGVVFSDLPNEPPMILEKQELVSLLKDSVEIS